MPYTLEELKEMRDVYRNELLMNLCDQLIEIMEEKATRLAYCKEQNGLTYCKNCGLNSEKG